MYINKVKKTLFSSIKIASLNYGGLLHSPFEFFDSDFENKGSDASLDNGQTPLQKLNQIFQKIASKQIALILKTNQNRETGFERQYDDEDFKWNINIFDKNMHRERYCPLYRKNVGVTSSRFLTKRQFYDVWDRQFQKNKGYIKWDVNEIDPKQQKRCRFYDFLMYRTFIQFCYQRSYGNYNKYMTQNFTEKFQKWNYSQGTLEDRIQQFSSEDIQTKRRLRFMLKQYNDFVNQFFSKPYLNQRKKFQQVIKIVDQHNVVFIQDTTDYLINQLKNNSQINVILPPCGKGTAIIFKQKNFKKLYDQKKIFDYQQQKACLSEESFIYDSIDQRDVRQNPSLKLKAGQKSTCVCFIDNFLFINIHFSSRTDVNKRQMRKLKQHKDQILKEFPRLNIVIGGDWNTDEVPFSINQGVQQNRYQMDCFPLDKIHQTTLKKRTQLQSQKAKSGRVDKKCRDFITTNMRIVKGQLKINGGLKQDEFLPNDNHIFDHAIISILAKPKN